MCFEMTAYGNDEFKGYEYGMAGLWVSLASYETADFFGPVLIDLYLREPQTMPPCFSTLNALLGLIPRVRKQGMIMRFFRRVSFVVNFDNILIVYKILRNTLLCRLKVLSFGIKVSVFLGMGLGKSTEK